MLNSHTHLTAGGDSAAGALDCRVKFAAAIIYSAVVIAQPKDSVNGLFVFAAGAFAFLVFGGIAIRSVFRQIVLLSPFVAAAAVWSIFYDTSVVEVYFGPMHFEVSSGVIRCFAIIFKYVITMMVLIGLVRSSRFTDLLGAMSKAGVPEIIVVQLGFIWRYIYVLGERAVKMMRSKAGRTMRYAGFRNELHTAASMVGSLFAVSAEQAQRVSLAMQGRGFSGYWGQRQVSGLKRADIVFIFIFGFYLVFAVLISRGMC